MSGVFNHSVTLTQLSHLLYDRDNEAKTIKHAFSVKKKIDKKPVFDQSESSHGPIFIIICSRKHRTCNNT